MNFDTLCGYPSIAPQSVFQGRKGIRISSLDASVFALVHDPKVGRSVVQSVVVLVIDILAVTFSNHAFLDHQTAGLITTGTSLDLFGLTAIQAILPRIVTLSHMNSFRYEKAPPPKGQGA